VLHLVLSGKGAGIRTLDGLEVKLLAIRKHVATWDGILKAGGKYNALFRGHSLFSIGRTKHAHIQDQRRDGDVGLRETRVAQMQSM
jgi:hypothetical protein